MLNSTWRSRSSSALYRRGPGRDRGASFRTHSTWGSGKAGERDQGAARPTARARGCSTWGEPLASAARGSPCGADAPLPLGMSLLLQSPSARSGRSDELDTATSRRVLEGGCGAWACCMCICRVASPQARPDLAELVAACAQARPLHEPDHLRCRPDRSDRSTALREAGLDHVQLSIQDVLHGERRSDRRLPRRLCAQAGGCPAGWWRPICRSRSTSCCTARNIETEAAALIELAIELIARRVAVPSMPVLWLGAGQSRRASAEGPDQVRPERWPRSSG